MCVLGARGCEPRLFGRPMDSWRSGTPPGMRLKSEGFASSIPDPEGRFTLKAFCEAERRPYADINLPTPVQTFIDYGDAFQRRYAPQLDRRLARHIRASSDGFAIELEDGTNVAARRCVIATGLSCFETIPEVLRGLASARVQHTAALSNYDRFAGARVLVVGAGASAANAAGALLRCGAEVSLCCRDAQLRFYPGGEPRRWFDPILAPLSPIGPGWRKWAVSQLPQAFAMLPERLRVVIVDNTLGPAPPWFVREEIEGRIEVLAGSAIVAAREAACGVEIEMTRADGTSSRRVFDHVLAGTGYKVDVERLGFLDPALRRSLSRVGGAPKLSGSFESSVPGLYFVGVAAAYQFGPALRFVCGAKFAARRVAAALVGSPGASRRSPAAPGAARAREKAKVGRAALRLKSYSADRLK